MNLQSAPHFMALVRRIPLPARRETNTFYSKRDTKFIMPYVISTLTCIPRAKAQHEVLTTCNYATIAYLDHTSWHCVPMVAPRTLQSIQLSLGCVQFICSARTPDEVPK